MGLDMYLHKKTYVKNWGHYKPEELHKVTVKKNGKTVKHIKPARITYIIETVCDWRKANHIHDWFVQNCQDGEDDCREGEVTKKQLEELLDILNQIKKDKTKASELLPTSEGFFFGETDCDESYYFENARTRKILKSLLEETTESWDVEYTYRSSW